MNGTTRPTLAVSMPSGGDWDKYDGVWTFEARDGGTYMHMTLDCDVNVPMIGAIIKGVIGKLAKANIDNMFEGIRRRSLGESRDHAHAFFPSAADAPVCCWRCSSCSSWGRCATTSCCMARSCAGPPRRTTCAGCASPAPRGLIVDCRGRVLATNAQALTAWLVPGEVPRQSLAATAAGIGGRSASIPISTPHTRNSTTSAATPPIFPVRLMSDLDIGMISRLEEQLAFLPGIYLKSGAGAPLSARHAAPRICWATCARSMPTRWRIGRSRDIAAAT